LVTGASAALATGAVLVVAALMLSTGSPVSAPDPASSSSGPSPSAPVHTGTVLDPRVQYADFGWKPDGATMSTVTVGRGWTVVQAEYIPDWALHSASPPSGSGSVMGSITLVVATADIQRDGAADWLRVVDQDVPGLPAQPVNGRPAEWVTNETATLRWEYAPGAWAAIVSYVTGVDAAQTAIHAAQTVRFGVDLPVRLPFHTPDLPAGLPLQRLSVSQGVGQQWSAEASYGTELTPYSEWPLTIRAELNPPGTLQASSSPEPHHTTALGGHDAVITSKPDGGTELTLDDVDGINVDITTHDAQTTALLDGGLEGLFLSTEFLSDPADWR